MASIDQFPAGERPFRDSKFRSRLNELVSAVNELLGRSEDVPRFYEFDAGEVAVLPRIQIDGATAISGNPNRWDYDWTLMEWDTATGAWVETATTSASDGYTVARNSLEDNNPADITTASGTLAIGSTLPITDATLMPFGSTTDQKAIVPCEMFSVVVGEETLSRPIFCQPNSFDCGA